MLSKVKWALPYAIAALPVVALAADFSNLESAFDSIINIINGIIIPLIVAVAGLYFMWGVISYVTAGGAEEKRTEGRNMMIYGIIALFVMISVWGLVNILVKTFDITDETVPLPETPTRN